LKLNPKPLCSKCNANGTKRTKGTCLRPGWEEAKDKHREMFYYETKNQKDALRWSKKLSPPGPEPSFVTRIRPTMCDGNGRISFRPHQGFDNDILYLHDTICKVLEVREMPPEHDNITHDLYAMVVTVLPRPPKGKKKHPNPLIGEKKKKSQKPYCFPIKITNCEHQTRDKMHTTLTSLPRGWTKRGENDYYNKETHEIVTVRPPSEQILELNLGHTNLTKVERTDHLVVWADWGNLSNKVIINNEDGTDGRNPEQAETHNITNRMTTGSSERVVPRGRSKDPKWTNSSPRVPKTIRIPLISSFLEPDSTEPSSTDAVRRKDVHGRGRRAGISRKSNPPRRRCVEENRDADPQKVLPSTLVLRRVKHRRLVVMERLLEEIIAAQNRDRN